MPLNFEARFWAKVEKTDGCWLWRGALSLKGYGLVNFNGKTRRAHRVAMLLAGFSLSPDDLVCHHCDTPACVRLDHLYVGTPAQNTADMMNRARHRHGRFPEVNVNATLAREQIEEIRRRREAGETYRSLAASFSVSASTILYWIQKVE